MKTTHTPGPWIITDDDCNEGWWFIGTAEDKAAVVGYDGAMTKENATLIAAAPDLLEALESILDGIDDSDQGDGYCEPVEILCWKIREAKSAIKKARGES